METIPLAGEEVMRFVTLAYSFTAVVLTLMVALTLYRYRRTCARLAAAEKERPMKAPQ